MAASRGNNRWRSCVAAAVFVVWVSTATAETYPPIDFIAMGVDANLTAARDLTVRYTFEWNRGGKAGTTSGTGVWRYIRAESAPGYLGEYHEMVFGQEPFKQMLWLEADGRVKVLRPRGKASDMPDGLILPSSKRNALAEYRPEALYSFFRPFCDSRRSATAGELLNKGAFRIVGEETLSGIKAWVLTGYALPEESRKRFGINDDPELKLWLAYQNGFAIVRCESLQWGKSKGLPPVLWWEVRRLVKSGEGWYPSEAEYHVDQTRLSDEWRASVAVPEHTWFKMKVESIEVDRGLRVADLDFKWPPLTRVGDRVMGGVYTAGEAPGAKVDLAKDGTVRAAVLDAVHQNAQKQAADLPATVPAKPAVRGREAWPWVLWAVGGAGGVLLVGGVWVLGRRARRRA